MQIHTPRTTRPSLPSGEYPPPIHNYRELIGASVVITCVVVSPFTPVHNVTNETRPPGPEHQATATNPAQPSYCTLPTFHPPASTDQATGLGYVSNDGHVFGCRNPVVLRQAFHVYVSGCLTSRFLTSLTNHQHLCD